MPSPARPPGISILMAWAPQSTSCRTHVGPARARVRSSTLNRARGNAPLFGIAPDHTPRRPHGQRGFPATVAIDSRAEFRSPRGCEREPSPSVVVVVRDLAAGVADLDRERAVRRDPDHAEVEEAGPG